MYKIYKESNPGVFILYHLHFTVAKIVQFDKLGNGVIRHVLKHRVLTVEANFPMYSAVILKKQNHQHLQLFTYSSPITSLSRNEKTENRSKHAKYCASICRIDIFLNATPIS